MIDGAHRDGDPRRVGRSTRATVLDLPGCAASGDSGAVQSETEDGALDRTSARRLGHNSPAVTAGRARLRPDSVGALVHAAIAVALAQDPEARGPAAKPAAQEVVARNLARVYRISLLHRVTSATAVYLCDLSRDTTDWALMASEVRVGDVRIDLLFAHRRTGQIQSDEIATGLLGPPSGLPWVMQRVQAQLALGRATFGDRFGGVRLVDLPRRQATLIDHVDA